MIDINMATTAELEEELERLYEEFEAKKVECYKAYVKLSEIQKEFDAVDKEIKKRNGKI